MAWIVPSPFTPGQGFIWTRSSFVEDGPQGSSLSRRTAYTGAESFGRTGQFLLLAPVH